ncbi:hypothetical protein TrCOL_g7424 [Triparma columacea]|uniref:Uncharacterized protein n=1 Tax=Triparma columacea TaxID=722753 RepID=A0A9W7GRR6_9STRA|nr:hypothetical protein TrCOL_g7424 [Triparma columacea]
MFTTTSPVPPQGAEQRQGSVALTLVSPDARSPSTGETASTITPTSFPCDAIAPTERYPTVTNFNSDYGTKEPMRTTLKIKGSWYGNANFNIIITRNLIDEISSTVWLSRAVQGQSTRLDIAEELEAIIQGKLNIFTSLFQRSHPIGLKSKRAAQQKAKELLNLIEPAIIFRATQPYAAKRALFDAASIVISNPPQADMTLPEFIITSLTHTPTSNAATGAS